MELAWGAVLQEITEQDGIINDQNHPKIKHHRVKTTIDKLPDKVLQRIFSYLSHREMCMNSVVCKKWRQVAHNTSLWASVSLRPEVSGLHVPSTEFLLSLIGSRFGTSLRYIELPIELTTISVLHELAAKCPNLTNLLLDFSTAMQLHDFSDMQAFPTRLRYLCICLSGVIFMEGFMRKIYNFINGLEVLHLIGTYEKIEEEEEEIYEVVNIHKLKSATPNLRVVNLYGINFVDDSHVEAFSSNCIQMECLAVNFCSKVTGSSFKLLMQRCRKLKSLLCQQTTLKSEHIMAVEWDKSSVQELNITATDLNSECLVDLLTRIPVLRWLSAGQLDSFTDHVMKAYMEKGNPRSLVALDLDLCDSLSEEALIVFLQKHGPQLQGLVISGIPHVTDTLWLRVMPMLREIRILKMGTFTLEGLNKKISVDQIVDAVANNCPRLQRAEINWDTETLRFSDKSQKSIDAIRVHCLQLSCLVLSDGKYYEVVKSNFERADRLTVVRTSTTCCVTNVYLLTHFNELRFN